MVPARNLAGFTSLLLWKREYSTMKEREIACSYTREILGLLGALYGESAEAVRVVFFEKLLRAGAQRLGAAQWQDELIEELYLATPRERFANLDFHARREVLDSIPEVPEQLASSPELIGWCFQIWNEPVRNAQSWAVSRKGEDQHESAELGVLTQLFTDEYLADLLIERCLRLIRATGAAAIPKVTICDPACGVGHILMAAVRRYSQDQPCPDWIGSSLFGFDIDPSAVAVARGLVFLQAFACGFSGDGGRLLRELRSAIVVLSKPYGSLQRGMGNTPSLGFDVVVTNPPYLGRRKMPADMRAFLDREYPAAKIDLCAAFMQRCVELCKPKGAIGFLTSDKWLRLRGYEVLRNGSSSWKGILRGLSLDLVLELGAKAFHPSVQLHDGVKATVLCAQNDTPPPEHRFQYSNVATYGSYREKVRAVQQLADQAVDSAGVFRIAQRDWRECGTGSVLLQASGLPRGLLESSGVVAQRADVVVGIQTSDDAHYVRYVWQVPARTPGWRIHSKGGGYARWCGLNRWVIDWERGAPRFFRTEGARVKAEQWADRDGWCYTWFANGALALRSKAAGWSFGRAAASGVFCDDLRLVAFLNSRFASVASRAIGGKIQLPEGVVRGIPIPTAWTEIAAELVSLAQEIKCELVRGDLTDVYYEPQLVRDVSHNVALEALVLIVEGVLEAQVERAVGLNRDDSERWGKEHGIPVAWLAPMHEVLSHPVWSCVPERLRRLRSVLACYADTMPLPRTSGLEAPLLEVSTQPPSGLNPGPYVLPTTGIVEHLSRLYQAHPFDVVRFVLGGSEARMSYAKDLYLSHLCGEVTRELMRALGHSWWSDPDYVLIDTPDSLCQTDLCAVVERCAQHRGYEHLLHSHVPTWIRRVLIPWQAKRFFGKSPLRFGDTSRGELQCSHTWLGETTSAKGRKNSITLTSSDCNPR